MSRPVQAETQLHRALLASMARFIGIILVGVQMRHQPAEIIAGRRLAAWRAGVAPRRRGARGGRRGGDWHRAAAAALMVIARLDRHDLRAVREKRGSGGGGSFGQRLLRQ